MNKNRLKDLAKEERFIPGIYNYCDRWCERCSFTTRCLTFAMEEEDKPTNEEYDLNNKKFWDEIHSSFQLAMELIQEEADKLGIDLNDIDTSEFKEQEKINKQKVKQHYLFSESGKYYKLVDAWIKNSKYIFENKENELIKIAELGLDEKSTAHAEEIIDLIEIIKWHQYFIHAKLSRALHGKLREQKEIDMEWIDADGSAKIALIAIERSIAAWGKILEIFPSEEDDILKILLLLSKLSKSTEKSFPNARSFRRPGFDDDKP